MVAALGSYKNRGVSSGRLLMVNPGALAECQGTLRVPCNIPVHQLKGVNKQLHPVLPLDPCGELGPLGGVDHHSHQLGVGRWVLSELRGV